MPWLHAHGAAPTSPRRTNGHTPMYVACGCHLSVCEWLFEVGAAKDITKADSGHTPMWIACRYGHLSVCEWLFEVGAAKDITKASITAALPCASPARGPPVGVQVASLQGALNTPAQHDDGHVHRAIVKRDTRYGKRRRPALLAVLRAGVILPDSHHKPAPTSAATCCGCRAWCWSGWAICWAWRWGGGCGTCVSSQRRWR